MNHDTGININQKCIRYSTLFGATRTGAVNVTKDGKIVCILSRQQSSCSFNYTFPWSYCYWMWFIVWLPSCPSDILFLDYLVGKFVTCLHDMERFFTQAWFLPRFVGRAWPLIAASFFMAAWFVIPADTTLGSGWSQKSWWQHDS